MDQETYSFLIHIAKSLDNIGLSLDSIAKVIRDFSPKEDKKEDDYAHLYSIPIDDLELTARPHHCLFVEGINSVGELVTRTEMDLLRLNNMGNKSVREVKDVLQERGLCLGMKIERK